MRRGSCVEDFSIHLLSRGEEGVYLTGDVIRGHVTLELLQHLSLTNMEQEYLLPVTLKAAFWEVRKVLTLVSMRSPRRLIRIPKFIEAIRISIKGRAFVHWTEQALRGVGEPRYKDTHHHSAVEDYFDHTLVLFGQTKNDRPEKCYLPAGRYTYPFKYQLPATLPSSFEGEFGYIRYWVKATIEKGREQCHVTQRAFTVISPLDLNKVPDSNNPVQETSEKQLCCFCCLSGPISAVLCLQKRGYVPGEPIKFGAEVSNMSSRKMSCYSVELKMTTIYKTPTKSRSVSRQICKTRRHSVGKGQTDTWMSDQLLVPPLPPSCLIGCSIISIKYTLELRVDPVGPAFDLTLPIEVVIGTIPHRITQEHHYANIHRQTSSNSNGTHRSGATDRSGDSQRQLIGVQVLPVQGGHLIINPAYSQQSSNRASAASASSSERSHPPQRPPSRTSNAPSQSSTLSFTRKQRHIRHIPQRPPSRTSNASSQSSTLSFTHKQLSTVFLESPYGRMHIQFEGDGKEFVPERHRFAPVYPVYQWRR